MTIRQRITNILAASDKAKNSDKELWIIYAQKSGVNLSPEQIAKIKDMPEFETLRRTRQVIQASGSYKADAVVEAARKEKASVIHQRIPFMDDDTLERTFDGRIILPWGQ